MHHQTLQGETSISLLGPEWSIYSGAFGEKDDGQVLCKLRRGKDLRDATWQGEPRQMFIFLLAKNQQF